MSADRLTAIPEDATFGRLDEHDTACRRCAVLVAAKVVEPGGGFTPHMYPQRPSHEDRILQIARWIVGEQS